MIGIISYGLGNVSAFRTIFKNLDIPACVVDDPRNLRDCSKLILPGVGSFDHAIGLLKETGFFDSLNLEVLEYKKPILGVCVGLQVMADSSEEGQLHGFGWFPGMVRKFNQPRAEETPIEIPHMGWNSVNPVDAQCGLFEKVSSSKGFYFLHSYYFAPSDDTVTIASSHHGVNFGCAFQRGNVVGVQFHPEKSHRNGIELLKNFAEGRHA